MKLTPESFFNVSIFANVSLASQTLRSEINFTNILQPVLLLIKVVFSPVNFCQMVYMVVRKGGQEGALPAKIVCFWTFLDESSMFLGIF